MFQWHDPRGPRCGKAGRRASRRSSWLFWGGRPPTTGGWCSKEFIEHLAAGGYDKFVYDLIQEWTHQLSGGQRTLPRNRSRTDGDSAHPDPDEATSALRAEGEDDRNANFCACHKDRTLCHFSQACRFWTADMVWC